MMLDRLGDVHRRDGLIVLVQLAIEAGRLFVLAVITDVRITG